MGGAEGEEAMPRPSGREEERILVSVRMRPLNEKEALRNEVADWECINNTTIVYKNHLSPERSLYPTSYTFDRVFGPDCSTRKVYEEGAKAVVLSVVSGINSSVFAYGQTSSGKTFTMSGITECTMEDIFNHIHKHKEREFHLKFSAMEIYNESVRDLLTSDNTPLRLLDDPERGTVVEKLTEATLRDRDHFKELIAVCQAQRQIGETFLNEVSSRSHQILRLTIESSTREFLAANNASTLTATLNLVDLAGSERASQALSAGSRLKEGSHINRSLLTLGTVIRKLSKGGVGHIPYRDSKLTRILQPSLGGNARTAVICTMSPARTYSEQSRNTLLFATRAKEVTTNAHVNVVMSDKALVKHLQRELARLENELRNTNPSVKADATDLLREKDRKIEELEGRVRELTAQLDHALSQLHDSQQQEEKDSSYPVLQVGNYPQEEKDTSYPVLQVRNHLQEEKDSSYPVLQVRNHLQEEKDSSYPVLEVRNHLQDEKDSSYPILQVRLASENCSSDTTTTAEQQSFNPNSPTCETPQSPERHSSSSYDESYSISDFEESLPPSSPSEEMFTEPSSVASSPLQIQTPKTAGHKLDSYDVPKGLGNQTAIQVDPYEVLEETSHQSLTSYEIGALQVSEPFQMPVQQTSHRHGAQSPYFVEFDPYELPDEIGDETIDYSEVYKIQNPGGNTGRIPEYDNVGPYLIDEPLEEYCKEVQCINSEMIRNIQANSLHHEDEKLSLLTGHGNASCRDDQPIDKTARCSDDRPTMEAVLGGENSPSSEEPRVLSDKQHKEEVAGFSALDHNNECRSNQSNDISSGSSSFSEKVKYGLEEVVVRLDDVKKNQLSDANDEVPKLSAGMTEFDGLPVKDIEVSDQMGDTVSYTSVTETKEMNDLQHLKYLPSHHQGDNMMLEVCKPIKTMKDVGLDPQDDLNASPHWPFDSTRELQLEIFDLWETCNESLVHRTQFFLLFIKGDQADTIYMEVERRRLSFIKDAFASGNSIVLDGHKLTPDSSKRSLQGEREMLGKLIKKRLSKQERINLYAKWCVNLASKRRSLQLAHHLWVNKTDMDHTAESANIVAKLIRFSEPQVPKEALGLNLMTNWRRRKSYR